MIDVTSVMIDEKKEKVVITGVDLDSLWIFHDERPILLKTISSLISEDQGYILKQGILYSMILTQAYVLIRRRN